MKKLAEEPHIYQQIIESIRQDIQTGSLKPGARLPTIRQMAVQWNCTIGTIMHAYQELANQGLVVSHVGQGTRVAEEVHIQDHLPLRRAILLNRIEAYLLEIMTSGYTPDEVEQATRMALDRWRAFTNEPAQAPLEVLRFVGSHDPAITLIAAQFHTISPGFVLQLTFAGSLGGLIALAEQEADMAGCHLWDEESDSYNRPFVRRLLPGRKVALLTLGRRQVGLIVRPGNPLALHGLPDLNCPDLRFVNRQPGSGTRVWLDAQLQRLGVEAGQIVGFRDEKMTHSEVAREIARGQADVGVGVQTAALSFGLDFVALTTERYELAIPAEKWDTPAIQGLRRWLSSEQAKSSLASLGGYDTQETGLVSWVS